MPEQLECPTCGKTFACDPEGDCWCKSYPLVQIPEALKGEQCLCSCALDKLRQEQKNEPVKD